MLGLVKDAPRPGRRPALSPEKIAAIVEATLHTTPPDATQWSVRTMAKAQGVSHAVVHRIWRAHGLQPHRVETFKLSRDPEFVKKLRDVVGVYLHPPDKALVFCVDEKPQVQALDRTEPVLPLRPGHSGATDARLRPARHDESVCGPECLGRHGARALRAAKRHTEFLAFLQQLDRVGPEAARDSSHSRQLRHAHASAMSRRGSRRIRATIGISCRPVRRGSTWWSAGSPRSPASAFVGAPSAACPT